MERVPEQEGAGEFTSGDVYHQFQIPIKRYIQGLVKNADETEDLLQETFLRVHKQLPNLKDPNTLKGWLYRIATNVSYDHLRRMSRLKSRYEIRPSDDDESSETNWTDTEAPMIDVAFDKKEMSACIKEMVEQFNDDYRSVLLLHDIQGLTNPEIAELLDISLDTVKIRLHRARKKLKNAMEEGCEFFEDDRGVLGCDPKSSDCDPKAPF